MLSKAPKLALFAFTLAAFSAISVAAQTPVAIPGTTPVGKSAAAVSVTVTIAASGTSTAPQALTQGIAGLDFQLAPGGTCAAGIAYTAGQQCTGRQTDVEPGKVRLNRVRALTMLRWSLRR